LLKKRKKGKRGRGRGRERGRRRRRRRGEKERGTKRRKRKEEEIERERERERERGGGEKKGIKKERVYVPQERTYAPLFYLNPNSEDGDACRHASASFIIVVACASVIIIAPL